MIAHFYPHHQRLVTLQKKQYSKFYDTFITFNCSTHWKSDNSSDKHASFDC